MVLKKLELLITFLSSLGCPWELCLVPVTSLCEDPLVLLSLAHKQFLLKEWAALC